MFTALLSDHYYLISTTYFDGNSKLMQRAFTCYYVYLINQTKCVRQTRSALVVLEYFNCQSILKKNSTLTRSR